MTALNHVINNSAHTAALVTDVASPCGVLGRYFAGMAELCRTLRNQYENRLEEEQENIQRISPENSIMLCCCCWPPYLCSLALSVIDTAVIGVFTFRAADLLYRSGDNSDWIDFVVFFISLCFFLCQVLSMSALALSYHRNNSRYVLPRLTLLTGQFAITTFISVVLILYFMGFSEKLNDAVINTYQYWSDVKLNDVERVNASHELFMYAVGIFILVIIYTIYELFELYITRKYQNTLDTPPEFIPVHHQEPARLAGPKLSNDQPQFLPPPPPPPYNPQYH